MKFGWAVVAAIVPGCSATPRSRTPAAAPAAPVIELREVGVGTELRIDAKFDGADTIFVRAISAKQCLDARFAVAADGRARAVSDFEGDVHACGRPVDPDDGVAIGIPIGMLVKFASSRRKVFIKGTTQGIELPGANLMTIGPNSFPIVRTILGIAHYCGAATVGVYQLDHETDTVEDVVEDASETYVYGSPDNPQTPFQRPLGTMVEIGTDLDVALDDIKDDNGRQMARECYDASPAGQAQRTCRTRENAIARTACEDACSARVETTRCSAGARACRALAQQDADDLAVCAQGFNDCVVEEGVEPAKLEQCTTACQHVQVESRCK